MLAVGAVGGIGRLGLVAAAVRQLFDPRSFFAAGEQGVWYDPSDLSTLFQDSAGTTPVSAVEQPVGRMLDKSGRGNHATQTTAIDRPILRQDAGGRYYLAFNGANTRMNIAGMPFSQDPHCIIAGVEMMTGVSDILLSGSPGPGGALLMTFGSKVRAHVWFSGLSVIDSTSSYTAPARLVAAQVLTPTHLQSHHNATVTEISRVGAVPVTPGSGAVLGGRLNSYLNGSLYGLILRAADSSPAQISSAKAWLAQRSGVTL